MTHCLGVDDFHNFININIYHFPLYNSIDFCPRFIYFKYYISADNNDDFDDDDGDDMGDAEVMTTTMQP